ncbi:hypothetical protein D0Z00_000167 [Geotrichum galactomycetum]|uniref:Uncharacterized protein n=1 Tax=Geotrichum galactomycetum TaxID=27317 RepID=A0ACB6VAS3_9ASCO|nr:hypothetical protein D0Z00_000167 [Geotrichum candidum]
MADQNDALASSPFIDNVQSSPFVPHFVASSSGGAAPSAGAHTPTRAARRSTTLQTTPLSTARKRTFDRFATPASVRSRGFASPLNPPRLAGAADSGSASNGDDDKSLRELVRTLNFQLASLRDDGELARLKHDQASRDFQAQLDERDRAIAKLKADNSFLYSRHTEQVANLAAIKTAAHDAQQALETRVRELRDELAQAHDASGAAARTAAGQRKAVELEVRSQMAAAQSAVETQQKTARELAQTRKKLEAEQLRAVDLEAEVDALKTRLVNNNNNSASESSGAAARVQAELSEQVTRISELETALAHANQRVQQLEDDKVVVAVVEDEKQALLRQLADADTLRVQLVEAELRLADAQAEQDRWALFLAQSDLSFRAPEDVVRALMQARAEKVGLLARVGRLEADAAGAVLAADGMRGQIDTLAAETAELAARAEKQEETAIQYKREAELATSEVALLREQLQSYDTEESVLQKKNPDTLKTERISELETLVDNYRKERTELLQKLATKSNLTANSDSMSPLKRKLTPYGSDERVAELTRKARTLQTELDELRVENTRLTQELSVQAAQLTKAEKTKALRVRVLELKDNPAARHEAVKQTMLTALKKENAALLAQVERRAQEKNRPLVPYASLEVLRAEMRELNDTLAEKTKRMERLKQVFARKSQEFRETVYALLGYRVDLLPNKKVRATSVYAPSEEHSFTFVPDPRGRTIKFTGIDDAGPLKDEYDNLISFWIKERQDISCFLAALNLELYDKTARASRF